MTVTTLTIHFLPGAGRKMGLLMLKERVLSLTLLDILSPGRIDCESLMRGTENCLTEE